MHQDKSAQFKWHVGCCCMHPYDAKHAYFPRDSARLHLLGEADVRPGGDVSSWNITNLDDVIGQSVQMAILTNNSARAWNTGKGN